MIYFLLFFEFFKIGALAIGGGLATIPFLLELSTRHHWYTIAELLNMIGISESTPGPIGINMAVFVGLSTANFWGMICSVSGIILPAFICTILISHYLQKYKNSEFLNRIFSFITPVICAYILFFVYKIIVLIYDKEKNVFLALFLISYYTLIQLKYNFSPIVLIGISSFMGVILKLC